MEGKTNKEAGCFEAIAQIWF